MLNCAASFRRRASSSSASAVIIGTWRVSAEAFVFPHLQEVSVPVFHLQRLQRGQKEAPECALLLLTCRPTLIRGCLHIIVSQFGCFQCPHIMSANWGGFRPPPVLVSNCHLKSFAGHHPGRKKRQQGVA